MLAGGPTSPDSNFPHLLSRAGVDGSGCKADARQERACQEPAVSRDPWLHHGHRIGQDWNPHTEPHDCP
jgi:hypothetical protein